MSRYEIKAGWEIPAVLEQALNSDLPGELKALVASNVYDTATGKYLLIPQGSRLVGEYNSRIGYGQDGVQVIWNRVIYPDFRESWSVACTKAGVPGLLFHDLRRIAVRNLRRAGVAESIIMKITGHRTRGVFERYNITDQTDTQEAGRMAEAFLEKEHEQDWSQRPEKDKLTETAKSFI